jgi:thiol-disulfide isomerase/thioredoxin
MLAEDAIRKLYQANRSKGLALVAINPNSPKAVRLEEEQYSDVGESLEDMTVRAQFRNFSYAYLFDGETQAVSMRYGPEATPSVFLFDHDRKLRYYGGIDSAEDAVANLLAGRPVATAATMPVGCAPKWKPHTADVAAELQRIHSEPVALDLAGAEELKKLRSNPTGKLLVVNFWATWCAPCVSEFDDLQAVYRTYRGRGLAFVTVAENEPAEKAAILKLLEKEHASTTNLVFASADIAALQTAFDPNMGAAVPFTVVITPDGDVVYQEEGEVTLLDLRRAILANLSEPKEYPGMKAYWSAK